MDFFARHSALRRSVALLLATILTSGCVTWRPVPSGQSWLTAKLPAHVRATLASGQVVDLYSPAVVEKDLIGYRQADVASSRVVLPMQGVQRVETLQSNHGATIALVAVLALGGLVVGSAIALHNMKFGGGFGGGF
ncbi:MAG: hypothetical protein ABR998_06800 [Gemmatimonadales bacterium]|jgi:hypothetical protein